MLQKKIEQDMLAAMKGKVLAQAELVGTYEKQR